MWYDVCMKSLLVLSGALMLSGGITVLAIVVIGAIFRGAHLSPSQREFAFIWGLITFLGGVLLGANKDRLSA